MPTEIEIVVRAIIIHNSKLLTAQAPEGYHALLGGHVEIGETLIESLKRELIEEIDLNAEIGECLCVIENKFQQGQRDCHEIGFYYLITPNSEFSKSMQLYIFDNGCKAVWINLNELEITELYPEKVKSLLIDYRDGNVIKQFIHQDGF
jgi:ADP-ribose pyrophosphatase YjhB (NUDIX family)